MLSLWVYCVLDVIATKEPLIRNLPKTAWLLLVLFFGPIGSIAWLALGRPAFAGWRPGDTAVRPARHVRGPEDLPGFAARTPEIDKAEQDRRRQERLRRWEERRRERDGGNPPTPPSG